MNLNLELEGKKFLDKKLKKILIKTKKSVFSNKIGNNTSKLKGEGYDFSELREYEDGEDVRKIDWMISAKMGKPYVKVFHAQRELDINIVSLMGGSVYFGTTTFKQEVICEIAALLGYSAIAQGDTFSSFITNTTTALLTKKTKNIFAVEQMTKLLYNYDVKGKKLLYSKLSDELYKKIRKKSIIFLLGDFINIDGLNLNLLAKKHEVIAIVVRDKFEESPVTLGSVNLVDPSSSLRFEGVVSKEMIHRYKSVIKVNDDILFNNFKKWGIDYIKIYTDDNVVAKMMRLFR